MSTESIQRTIPGAPPPAPLSKAQKKKRRTVKKEGESEPNTPAPSNVVLPDAHAAALTEKAPEEKDVKSGAVADELVAHPEAPKSDAGDGASGSKPSPVVDLLNKRLKAIGKKITRIHAYSSKPTSELNDDQKKTLATLPSLEAVRKELEETKKAVETLEADQAKEATAARAAAEQAERKRVADSVAAAQREHVERTAQILDIFRLQALLSNADPTVQALNLMEAEINAIYAAVNALLAQEAESKQPVLQGLLLGEGDVEGVSFDRFFEILDAYSQPTVQEEAEAEAEAEIEAIAEAVVEAIAEAEAEAEAAEAEVEESIIQPAVIGIPGASGGTTFRFVQDSELDADAVSLENGTEWDEKQEAPQESVEVTVSVEVKQIIVPDEAVEARMPEQAGNGGLNWAEAEDEGELPSIDGLHATFGTSGSGAPASAPAPAESQKGSAKGPAPEGEAGADAPPNGHAHTRATDDDGFTQARGGRGRGRPRGFRGGERGAYHRGGDRGGFRGGRGYRGRPNQGSESGNWREGDQRGRARVRGRGGFDRGARGVRTGGNEE